MWAWRRQNGRGPLTNSGAVARPRESLNKPHVCDRPSRPDRRDLPLPRQGPDPGAARPRRAEARPDAVGRPPLRHRERPLRLRPGRAEMAAETALPDADAGRMAGRPAHPVRRCEQRPLDQPQRPDRGPGQSRNARGPADDRELLRLDFSRSDQGTAEGAGKSWPQFFGRRPQGRLHHQSRQRPRHREHGRRAGPSASLPRQPLCRGLAGLARIRPRSTARWRSAM